MSLAALHTWYFARNIVPLVSTTFHQIHLDFWLTHLSPDMYRTLSFLRCGHSLRVKHVQERITRPRYQWTTVGISPIHVRYSVLSLIDTRALIVSYVLSSFGYAANPLQK
jgi:hypothetical protein